MIHSSYFLLVFVAACEAVPLQNNGVRIRRDEGAIDSNYTTQLNECTIDNVVYKVGQDVPSLSPCEKCICAAPDVVCSMIKCQPNSGCRILQQSGQCCPEYKCDCEYNGRLYNNGERLDKPEDPCQVCYCKGGEIMCTSITCYERDDCQPHFSPGQCCPKYDHCPIESNKLSNNSVRSVNSSVYSPKREMQPWPLTKPSNSHSSVSYDETNWPQNNVYPQTIKIVEILPTTPGYSNKPSEVSIMPRVKTNDDDKNDDYTKYGQSSKYENSTDVSNTTESFENPTSSASTFSEVDHLLDTTTAYHEDTQQSIEVIPERTISISIPLTEEVSVTESQSGSQNLATALPLKFDTESGFDNSQENSTFEGTTEIEGSGYELLRGGLYEELPSESPEYSSVESTTEALSTLSNGTSFETRNETQENQSYDLYSTTETTGEQSISLARILQGNFTNDTSAEVFDSSDESNNNLSNFNKSIQLESVSLLNSDSSSSEESIMGAFKVEKTTSEYEKISYLNLNSTEIYYSAFIDDTTMYNTSENPSTQSPVDSANTTENENLISTVSSSYDDIHHTPSNSETEIPSSTLYSGTNEVTTESEYSTSPRENKKMSRLTYRKVDNSAYDNSASSTLTFPSVMSFQSLGTDQTSSQAESDIIENSTTMARVGIYHPAKPNELAGYLTIVDEKLNTSSLNESLFSSHLLLTPHDLKKLAEILIHEEIKPAFKDGINKSLEQSNEDFENAENLTYETRSDEDSGEWNDTTNSSLEEDRSIEISNNSPLKSTVIPEPNDAFSTANESESFNKDETVVSTVSPSSPQNPMIEDPNTSRQIRIPETENQPYSTLLDDRDLLILENFFRKNIGLH